MTGARTQFYSCLGRCIRFFVISSFLSLCDERRRHDDCFSAEDAEVDVIYELGQSSVTINAAISVGFRHNL